MASRKKLVGNNLCFIELDPTSCKTYADGMRVLGKAPTQEFRKDTLQETNISPQNGILKMIFLFPRWDMLIPWRIP